MSAKPSSQKNLSKSWTIRIYIRPSESRDRDFLKSVQDICRQKGLRKNTIQVVDVESSLTDIERKALIDLPMLVRVSPAPVCSLAGFTEMEKVQQVFGLDGLPRAPH